jgi:ubiquinone/menaquinone biosynthesis C-methylase UbiE
VSENNSKEVGEGFDRITFIYDAFVSVCSLNRINISQLAFLSQLSTQNNALILGGGTGYFLQKVLEKNESIHITYVDVSAKMIAYAKKRIEKNRPEAVHRVTFICAGVEDLDWKSYDVIVCNFILDLFDNSYVQVLAEKFKNHLNPKGLLYVTDFHISEINELLKCCTQIGLKVLYKLFRWTTQLSTKHLPEIDKLLKQQGFSIVHSKYFLSGILMCRLYTIEN